jgi:hypothetical protein
MKRARATPIRHRSHRWDSDASCSPISTFPRLFII